MGGMGGRGASAGGRGKKRPGVTRPDGATVTVDGLSSRPELNGQEATITGFDGGRGRYVVELLNGESLSLKPENLHQKVSNVKLVGLSKRPELNNTTATILTYHDGRYNVQPSGGSSASSVLSLKPGNCVLPNGTIVTVVGLQKGTEHNNHNGRVLSFDDVAGRYLVDIGGHQLKLKPENAIA
eukprot:m.106655 g.106655  ORF g.106655 m.106655 type:complete len:183 (-) comp15818_c7_seq1:372-920(-)